MTHEPPAILDAAHAEFIRGAVSINAAACRPGALPALARAVGCRVSADRCSVTILLAATPGTDLLDGVRRSGAIAVVFSQPSTHRTLQLKGADARILPIEAGDAALIDRYCGAFVAHLAALGYPEEVTRRLLACPKDDVVAVCFTPLSVFSQTPGPRAGEPLAGHL